MKNPFFEYFHTTNFKIKKMKKLLMTAAAVFAFGFANAQEAKFGVKAGVDFATSTVSYSGFSASASETGFYAGGFADIELSDKFHFQPELLYVAVKDMDQVQIPLLAKYQVAEKFNLLAGPNLGFFTKKTEGMKSFNYGIDFGASYDITENIILDAKYNLGLANLIENAPSGYSAKVHGLFVGAAYRF